MELNKTELLELMRVLRERIDFERSQEKREVLAELITRVQIPKALSEGLAKVLIDEGVILKELRGFDVGQWQGKNVPDLYAIKWEDIPVSGVGIEIDKKAIEVKRIEVKGSQQGWVSYGPKDRSAWRVVWLDFANWVNLNDPTLTVCVLYEPHLYAADRLTLQEAKKRGTFEEFTVDLRSLLESSSSA
jgi:hypothetical protein